MRRCFHHCSRSRAVLPKRVVWVCGTSPLLLLLCCVIEPQLPKSHHMYIIPFRKLVHAVVLYAHPAKGSQSSLVFFNLELWKTPWCLSHIAIVPLFDVYTSCFSFLVMRQEEVCEISCMAERIL